MAIFPQLPVRPLEPSEQPRGVRVVCITDEYFDGADDWPTRFQALPRVGDWVRSKTGRHLCIHQVTHAVDMEGAPIIEVSLGIERTAVTPTEGGDASL